MYETFIFEGVSPATATAEGLGSLRLTFTFPGGSKLRFYRDGRCTFEGNADEAAKLFFEHVAKAYLPTATAEGLGSLRRQGGAATT